MAYNRRKFIQNSIYLAGGAGLLTALPLGYSCRRPVGANDKIRIGLIGCKNMGFSNLQVFITQPDVEIIALCDIDSSILNQRAADIEAFAYENNVEGFSRPELFSDFRKVLDRKDIDAVIIATPDHWHALITILACQAGKDVYVEKPMANSIGEAEEMVKAGDRYQRIIQVGQWQRSGPHWHDVMEFIQSGELGTISEIDVWRLGGNEVPVMPDSQIPTGVDYDMWLGPARNRPFNPNRFHYNFRWFWDYAGGKMTDWGVHLLDMAIQAMDVHHPRTIKAEGGKFCYPLDAMETPDLLNVEYNFNNLNIRWKNDFCLQENEYNLDHGLVFKAEKGQLVASRKGWKVVPNLQNGGPLMEAVEPRPATGKDLGLHVRNFLDAIKSRDRETNCSAKIGRDVARMAHMGNISYRTGETLHWNSETSTFSESSANLLLMPEYRLPWQLPNI